MDEESNRRTPMVLLAGAAAVLLLIGGVYLLIRWTPSPAQAPVKVLPMGPKEQTYAQQIHFLDPSLSRAANFLNQEVTLVFGSVSNDGPLAIRQIEITLEFQDPFKEVVLRDTERLLDPTAGPLAPHQRRDFQLSYETLPATWGQSYPIIRITGLDLQ